MNAIGNTIVYGTLLLIIMLYVGGYFWKPLLVVAVGGTIAWLIMIFDIIRGMNTDI